MDTIQKLLADNQEQLQLWLTISKIRLLLEICFLIAVPVMLFLIWRELARANEQKRIERILHEARNPFAKGQ